MNLSCREFQSSDSAAERATIFQPVVLDTTSPRGTMTPASALARCHLSPPTTTTQASELPRLAVANGSHDNTAMGHYTQGNLSTGTWNSSLGSFACNGVTTGQNNLCLGGDADISGSQYYQTQIGAGVNAIGHHVAIRQLEPARLLTATWREYAEGDGRDSRCLGVDDCPAERCHAYYRYIRNRDHHAACDRGGRRQLYRMPHAHR